MQTRWVVYIQKLMILLWQLESQSACIGLFHRRVLFNQNSPLFDYDLRE